MDDLCYDNRLNICEIEHKAGPFHTNTFLCPQAQPKAAKLALQKKLCVKENCGFSID